MKRGLEWVLTGTILLGSCAKLEITEQEARLVEDKPIETNYDIGIKLTKLAENEPDKKKRADLYANAFNNFEMARKFEGRQYDALLRQADCLSNLGEMLTAIELANQALAMDVPKKSKSAGYNVKGTIAMRHNLPEMAAECYTESIKHEDNPVARWNRYDATMRFAITPDGIRMDFIDRSLEDLKKYTEFKKEEPDGYLAQFILHSIKSRAYQSEEKDAEALNELKTGYLRLRSAIALIEQGKQPKRNIGMTIEQFRQAYDELKKVPELQPKEF
ncbi:MAG: hypothetical protein QW165_04610 [Candidatus Woesearchaeota archaeon]